MKILFISLGCDKNLTDSEKMLALLTAAGHEITDDETQAQIAIINTCAFISDAKEESIQTIIETAALKETGCLQKLIITGCLAQRYRDEIAAQLPEVDGMLGIASFDKIAQLVEETVNARDEKPRIFDDISDNIGPSIRSGGARLVTGPGHYAYLKVAEGCNKNCTYCAIPSIRGRYHSIPMEHLAAEAAGLADKGVKELILVAQETTLYGVDLYGRKMLPELIERLSRIEGIAWIRLLYCYPEEITDELIATVRDNPKVCHYLDMPIQQASDAILRRMGRRTDHRELTELIGKLRREIPDIALRTTLIAGFPGETDEDHEICMEFIDETEFDRLGVFTYSPEEGTKAAEYTDQVPEDIKQQRMDEIMSLQKEISEDRLARFVGRRLEVMTEGYLPDEGCYVGRSRYDAPDVDGMVFFEADAELVTGDIVTVEITASGEYDLTGVLYEPAE
ncbi:MAG: 30S ribosomal protein S12 methylthiotransferase RimO [Lachnospiraceae bacterium]|nr:30S ribosomal protein S12 methylthiotransferase RimO [Lachnospiraceae bacterium]